MGYIIEAYGSAAAPMIVATITAFLASLILCFLPLDATKRIKETAVQLTL